MASRAEVRDQRNAMYEKRADEWPDGFLSEDLTRRYGPVEVPTCRVCGGELSVQSVGTGGPTVWGCSGTDDDGRLLPDRRMADEHYSRSRWEDYRQGGDELVMELLRRYGKAKEDHPDGG